MSYQSVARKMNWSNASRSESKLLLSSTCGTRVAWIRVIELVTDLGLKTTSLVKL